MGQMSPDSFRVAIQFFRRALDVDATYARSYAGLARCYATSGHLSFMPPKEAFTLAKAAAKKALEFDQNLPDAHIAMGLVFLWYEWQWKSAEEEFRAAMRLSPNDADAHLYFGVYYILQEMPDEAIREARRALDLDPLSPRVSAMLAWVLCFAGQVDAAVEQIHRTLELDPESMAAKALLAETHLLKGRFKEAVKIFQPWPWAKAHLGMAYALDGDHDSARQILTEIKAPTQAAYQSRYDIGMLALVLGNVEEGFDFLEKSFAERDPKLVFVRSTVDVTPELQVFREHPRYHRLLERLGYGDGLGVS